MSDVTVCRGSARVHGRHGTRCATRERLEAWRRQPERNPVRSSAGTAAGRRCLDTVPRQWLHLSPLGDLLGVLVMVTLPTFQLPIVQRIQLAVPGCGCAQVCHPAELKVGLNPRRVTVRLHEAPLLRFGLRFDSRGRPDLKPLAEELARVRQTFPELTTVQLQVADDVELDLLIAVADLCIGAGLPSVIAGYETSDDD